ncbi:amidohydrolase family protein [Hephaestia sp. GCM10023244]|uniref:amidohydrolase family protein n=1 Tax=unclassified Hephaestia TaxID=2631281 RepID=UPI00207791F0|nr:amidohydrolase family protein [Hephaestia sp. MAHUQ-44]MCM8732290.1 amidohydrolase [Hephaestia sp. MAHUQ-44]
MQNPPVRLFDTHAHFFTNDIARFPIEIAGAREGRESILRRIDAEPATAARILGLWNENGVTGGAAVQYNTVYKTDNSYTLAVADAHRDRISAVLILSAAEPETPAMLDTLARTHNVRGLRLFGYPDDRGDYPWLDSPAALDTWEVAAAHKLTMVVMYAPGQPSAAALGRIVALARRFAPMTIALDHCGWPAIDAGVEGTLGAEHLMLAEVPNIVFKFTQINLNRFRETGIDAARFLRHIVDIYGAGRVMWGSDYGNTKETYAEMVTQAVAATSLLDASERDRVLHANGQRLFGG